MQINYESDSNKFPYLTFLTLFYIFYMFQTIMTSSISTNSLTLHKPIDKRFTTIISLLKLKNLTKYESILYLTRKYSDKILLFSNIHAYILNNTKLPNDLDWSVNKMSITFSHIREIESNLFLILNNLIYLNLHNNLINFLNFTHSSYNYNLTVLDLSYNQIKKLNFESLIRMFPNLTMLNLENNKITDLKKSYEIESSVYKNSLTLLPRQVQLRVLNLRGNNLSSLDTKNAQIWQSLPLKTLILDDNPFNETDLKQLQYIFKNKFISILSAKNTSNFMRSTKQQNKLDLIPTHVFGNKIKLLDISHNNISLNCMNAQTFANLTQLIHLNLRGVETNNKKDYNETFYALKSKHLILHINSIIGILSALQGINMSNPILMENRLKWIDLSGIDVLKTLDVCLISNLHLFDQKILIGRSGQKLKNKIKELKTSMTKFGNWLRGVALNGTILVLPNLNPPNDYGYYTNISKYIITMINPYDSDNNNKQQISKKLNRLDQVKTKLWLLGNSMKAALNSEPGNTVISNKLFDLDVCKGYISKGKLDYHNLSISQNNITPNANFEYIRINWLKQKLVSTPYPQQIVGGNAYLNLNKLNMEPLGESIKTEVTPNQERLFIKLKSGQDILLKCPYGNKNTNNIIKYWEFYKSNPLAYQRLEEHSAHFHGIPDMTWPAIQPIEISNEGPLEAPLSLYDIPVVSQIAKKYYGARQHEDTTISTTEDGKEHSFHGSTDGSIGLSRSRSIIDKRIFDIAEFMNLEKALFTERRLKEDNKSLTTKFIVFWFKDKALAPINDVDNTNETKIRKEDQNLLIKSLRRSQTGLYSCYVARINTTDNAVNVIKKGADFVVFLGDDFFIQLWRNSVLLALCSAVVFLILTFITVYSIKFIRMCQCIRARAADRKFTELVRELQQQTYSEIDNLRSYYMNQLNKLKDNCLGALESVGQTYTLYTGGQYNKNGPANGAVPNYVFYQPVDKEQQVAQLRTIRNASNPNNVHQQQENELWDFRLISPFDNNKITDINGTTKNEDGLLKANGYLPQTRTDTTTDGESSERRLPASVKEEGWYWSQVNRLREYTALQIEKMIESYGTQVERLNTFTYAQMEKVRAQYKISAKNIAEMIEMMNLDHCRQQLVVVPTDNNLYSTALRAGITGGALTSGETPAHGSNQKEGTIDSVYPNSNNNNWKGTMNHLNTVRGNNLNSAQREHEMQIRRPLMTKNESNFSEYNYLTNNPLNVKGHNPLIHNQSSLSSNQEPCCSNSIRPPQGGAQPFALPPNHIPNAISSPPTRKKKAKKLKKSKRSTKKLPQVGEQNLNNQLTNMASNTNNNREDDPFFNHSRMVLKAIRDRASAQLASAYDYNKELYQHYFGTENVPPNSQDLNVPTETDVIKNDAKISENM